MIMKKTINSETKKKIIKKAAICAVMFSMGVSTFAQGHSLFNKSQEPNMGAVNDMFNIMTLQEEAKRDGVVTSVEKQTIDKAIQNYNSSYGKDAYNKVNNGIADFFKSKDGQYFLGTWKAKQTNPDITLKKAIYNGIKTTSNHQKLTNYEIER